MAPGAGEIAAMADMEMLALMDTVADSELDEVTEFVEAVLDLNLLDEGVIDAILDDSGATAEEAL